MIQVYAFPTPNSVRVPIALEEMGIEYELIPVNVRKGEQKLETFLTINPNGKVPVLVDPNGPDGVPFVLSESSAILIYLAEKYGKLLPATGSARARVFEQMSFHISGIGPTLGQLGYFLKQAPEALPGAITRFRAEAERVMRVLDRILGATDYAAGNDFTIADITHFGWLWRRQFADLEWDAYPNVERWYNTVAQRPAVNAALAKLNALLPAS